MRATLKQSPYYDEEEWRLYETVRPELTTILLFLRDIGFDPPGRRQFYRG